MKEQIQQLIATGQTKEALLILSSHSEEVLLLQAQYNNGEKQFNLGLIDFGEWGRIQARVNFAALEIANKIKTLGSHTPTTPIIVSPIQQENMLLTFDKLFEDIQRDLNAKNYVQSNVERYVNELNRLTRTTMFSSLLDPTKTSDWSGKLNAEKNLVLKSILDSLWSKKSQLRARIEQRVDKENANAELTEVKEAFFSNPTTSRWQMLHKILTERFADKSLFSEEVLEAWKVWETKLASFQTDLDWGMEFAGSQEQRDLQVFINKNLQIKNWNE